MNVFKNRSFAFMWIGNTISELAGAFGTFCNSLLIYEMTGSSTALGSMWLLYFIPSLALQLFIGPYIDKWSRKWTMVFALWSRGIVFLIPLLGYQTGSLVPWHIYIVQVIIGLITPIYVPANQSILPTIVLKNQLQAANAYVDGTVRLMTFLAPAIAGIVIEYIGINMTLILICALLLVSGCLILGIHEERMVQSARRTWMEEFMEGMSYFFQQKTILWLGIFLAFVQLGVGVAKVINLPYVTDVLNESYSMYGYFMAGFPLGYVIGTTLVGKISFHSRRIFMLGSLMVGGLTYVNLGITSSILWAITTEMIAGIVMAFFSVYNISICQKKVPNHLTGKVFSVRSLINRGMMPLGVLVGGVFSDSWGIRPLYISIGLMICAISSLGMVFPYFRFIDEAEG